MLARVPKHYIIYIIYITLLWYFATCTVFSCLEWQVIQLWKALISPDDQPGHALHHRTETRALGALTVCALQWQQCISYDTVRALDNSLYGHNNAIVTTRGSFLNWV